MAGVPLLEKQDLADDYQYLLDTESLGERNILRALGNQPKILQSYMRYGTTLWSESELSVRQRELVILMVARTLRSRYEWQQHVIIGMDAGLTEGEITAIGRRDSPEFSDKNRTVLEYARKVADGTVDDSVFNRLREYCSPPEIVGIVTLVSHYVATARIIDGLDIPLEDEFVGWRLEYID